MDSSNGFTYEINEISNKSTPTDLAELKNEIFDVNNETDKSPSLCQAATTTSKAMRIISTAIAT